MSVISQMTFENNESTLGQSTNDKVTFLGYEHTHLAS